MLKISIINWKNSILKIFLGFEHIHISLSSFLQTPKVNNSQITLTQASLSSKDLETTGNNFIEVYDGSTSSRDKVFSVFANESNRIYKSQTNRIYVRYSLNKININDYVRFKMAFNSYKLGKNVRLCMKVIQQFLYLIQY